MKKIIFTLLAMSILMGASAQNKKCAIDTKALVAEEIAAGASSVKMIVKMTPNFDRAVLEKAGMVIGAQAGEIITLRVPVEALPLLESNKEVLQYSISHRIAAPDCNNNRFDTRTDSVQAGLGLDLDTAYTGEGVYIGITDWGFDYTHPNYNHVKKTNFRLDMAWDHFRNAGPAPEGFDYGTLISGRHDLLAAKGDTSNLYGYGTHGTHVAGICAGRGVDGNYTGQAPYAKLLFCSFGLGEAEWMEAVEWMRRVAADSSRRLVINSSWGMYSFSTLDGTSLLSQAINRWSDEGTVFCTSGGNNGRSSIPFHISRTFTTDSVDTLRTVAVRASSIYSISEKGQVLIMWGEEGHDFSAGFRIWKNSSTSWDSPFYSTADGDTVIYDTVVCGDKKVGYSIMIEHSNPFDQRPHIQLNVSKINMETQLFITAASGTVHAWNVADKENHAGNEGCTFSKGNHTGFTAGDNLYGVGEPACAAKCISVAAHNADRLRDYTISVTMYDYSGDGWHGARLCFYQNDSLLDYAQLTTGQQSGTKTIRISNSSVPVFYTWQSGGNDSDCYYSILFGNGEYIYTSDIEPDGVNHSGTIVNPNPISLGNLAAFSSIGPLINGEMKPEISAPGVDVISSISAWQVGGSYPALFSTTVMGQRYTWAEMSGTSMSCPATTGIVALLLQANPRLSVDQVRYSIFSTARNDSLTGPLVARDSMDTRWGWGKIDARRAVNKALSLVSINQVEELRTPLKVFPNPATQSVRVLTYCGERQMLKVYSIDGRMVMQTPVEQETTLNVGSWPRGVYILRVGSRTEKLVVK